MQIYWCEVVKAIEVFNLSQHNPYLSPVGKDTRRRRQFRADNADQVLDQIQPLLESKIEVRFAGLTSLIYELWA
jgi:hypothetical protein